MRGSFGNVVQDLINRRVSPRRVSDRRTVTVYTQQKVGSKSLDAASTRNVVTENFRGSHKQKE